MPAPIECSNCHERVASTVTVAGVEHLHADGIALHEAHGRCVHCGAQFHWEARDAQFDAVLRALQDPKLARLIDRVLKQRRKYNQGEVNEDAE